MSGFTLVIIVMLIMFVAVVIVLTQDDGPAARSAAIDDTSDDLEPRDIAGVSSVVAPDEESVRLGGPEEPPVVEPALPGVLSTAPPLPQQARSDDAEFAADTTEFSPEKSSVPARPDSNA